VLTVKGKNDDMGRPEIYFLKAVSGYKMVEKKVEYKKWELDIYKLKTKLRGFSSQANYSRTRL
jgi:hypothetical protein